MDKKSYKLNELKHLIPYGKQTIDETDIEAVVEVLKSDYITTGPKVKEFEDKLADYAGAKYAVVFNSGTSALHASYFSIGLSENDEFITSPMSFTATSNAGLFLNAKPVFCDIDFDTGNIDENKIEELITIETKMIVPVHYAGQSCNMKKIKEIADKYGLKIVEDACHALGGQYLNEKIGNCKYSDITVFSFHPVKNITTGEGGAVFTNNEEYYKKLLLFRNHGICKHFDTEKPEYYYEMQFLGYNYRMTDFQAALGVSQLKKLDDFILKRQEIVNIYNFTFEDNDYFYLPTQKEYANSANHLYPIKLKNYQNRDILFKKLKENNIGVQVHYIPIYFHPYYQNLGYNKGICPNAEKFYYSEISLPVFPLLQEDEVCRVIDVVIDNCEKL